MGASGFVGSHVIRKLVARGDNVRVWIRPSSTTRPFEDFDVEIHRGELTDDEAIRTAMTGVDAVHYCIVDARPNLRDNAPLWNTNVHGLRHALDAAVATEVPKFVFCSTVGTIGIAPKGQLANEETPHTWARKGGEYIEARLAAENLVLQYVREKNLPAVVLNVSTPFGPWDYNNSPHGGMIAAAANGQLPIYMKGGLEFVGVEDVADAFLLAEERGRVGERYIISERFMPWKDVVGLAAQVGGVEPPTKTVPTAVLLAMGAFYDAMKPFSKKDPKVTKASANLSHIMSPSDHSKATRELGWVPAPTEVAIKRAALFYTGKDPDLASSI
jgi:dihydroflavonol-4-reductase